MTARLPVLGLAGLVVACAGNAPPEGEPPPPAAPMEKEAGGLWATSWQLEDLGGAGVIDDALATLEFPERGRVAGRGSCNRFFGSVQITGESIALGQLGSTRMACAEAVMNQEARYFKALESAERYAVKGDELLVYVRGLDRPLRFTRAEP